MQVFYASSGRKDVQLFWATDRKMSLCRVRFEVPPLYSITDAALCRGMSKMALATDKGRLLLFSGRMENKLDPVDSPADEQVELKHLTKVVHQVLLARLIRSKSRRKFVRN